MKKGGKIQKNYCYGLLATVVIGPGFVHAAGWGPILIPHPPLVNWLLRQDLSEKNREALTFIHEFEHLRSALPVLLYMSLLIFLDLANGQSKLSRILLILISSQAWWEIISEFSTFQKNKLLYNLAYNGTTIWPRILFWMGAIFIAVGSGLMILY